MTYSEYQSARASLQYTVPEWCALLGISLSSHTKYSAGIRPVPHTVAQVIKLTLENTALKREKLIRSTHQ